MKRLWLFGAIFAQEDDGVLPVPAGRPRELLACLALRATRPRSRDVLAGMLYPDSPSLLARRALADALHRLRRSLGEGWLSVQGDALGFDARAVWVDATAFQQSTDPSQALQLYHADLAEEVEGDWILGDRMRLRDRCVWMMEHESRRLLALADGAGAIPFAQRWADVEPLSEDACAVLMRAYAGSGCFDLALRRYERYAAELSTELSQSPSRELQDLAGALHVARQSRRQCETAGALAALAPNGHAPMTAPSTSNAARARLVRAGVPLGQPLRETDYTDVWWTVDGGDEDAVIQSRAGAATLRHHRLRRLISEARNQGAAPTHADLARALGVSTRTIARDLALTHISGTRRSALS